jgi:hypothetical protein
MAFEERMPKISSEGFSKDWRLRLNEKNGTFWVKQFGRLGMALEEGTSQFVAIPVRR